MSNDQRRKKNKTKHALWEAMETEQLMGMLGKRGRAKAIRNILRKRQEVMLMLDPNYTGQLIK